jgi:TPR repeat protein
MTAIPLILAWFVAGALASARPEAGDGVGMNNLATTYEDGPGVARGMAEALAWYRKAAAPGNQDAKENLKRLGQ